MLEHSSASGSWTQMQSAFGFNESTLKGPDDIFSTYIDLFRKPCCLEEALLFKKFNK